MQQFSPISVLPASTQANGQPSQSSLMSGGQGTVLLGSDTTTDSAPGNGFGQIFVSVSDTSGAVSEFNPVQGWNGFAEQYPELMELLGSDFDFESFFSQFQLEGQSLTLPTDAAGEFLPLEVQENLGAILGQMTAWFKQSGYELALDDSGQIVPVQFNQELNQALPGVSLEGDVVDADLQVLDKIAAAISQLVADMKEHQPQEEGQAVMTEHVVLSTSALGTTPAAAVTQASQPQAAGVNVAGPAVAVATDTATGVNAQSQSATELSSGQTSGQQSFTGQQGGGFQQGQNDSDAQFKAFIDGQVTASSKESSDPLLTNVTAASDKKFSEVQARIPDAGLKQYSTGVNVPVQDPEWSGQMAQKVVWMTGRNIQSAEIHLNPPDFGPVEVKISMQNDQAAISFNVQNATVRELLESNVQRLREMMESNGVELADVDVSSEQDQQRYASENGEQLGGNASQGEDSDGEAVNEESVTVTESSAGLVDFYA